MLLLSQQLSALFLLQTNLGRNVRHSREGNGTPLQYSCLENPWTEEPGRLQSMGVSKSRTWLSNFTFTFHFHALEKEMATHSSVLAWRIPGTGKPGGLPSMGLHRVGHDWSDLAAAAAECELECRVRIKGGRGYTCGLYIKEWDDEHCWGCRGKESIVHGWYEYKLV